MLDTVEKRKAVEVFFFLIVMLYKAMYYKWSSFFKFVILNGMVGLICIVMVTEGMGLQVICVFMGKPSGSNGSIVLHTHGVWVYGLQMAIVYYLDTEYCS
jgi:membrane-bound metal-dependent hydrolase YbcI (DUF457 family)